MKKLDLSGKRFGRLLVLDESVKRINNRPSWNCVCDCGNNTVVNGSQLNKGRTKSCGCLRLDSVERMRKANTTHGMTNTSEFHIWDAMKQRCSNSKKSSYKHYGARGIKVCDRWLESFENFYADMGERPEGCSLDRIDNDGDYSPENCRWATAEEQGNNRRTNRSVSYEGVEYTISELARHVGIPMYLLWSRIVKYGWDVEKAVSMKAHEWKSEYFSGENNPMLRTNRILMEVENV